MLAVRFYDFVASVHVMAIVIAFGIVFAYPIVLPWFRARHAGSLPVAHEMMGLLGGRVIAPAGGVALVAGIYLASDAHLWGRSG